MNKQTVLVTDYVFAGFDQERKILAEVGTELKISQCKSIAELKPLLPGVHGCSTPTCRGSVPRCLTPFRTSRRWSGTGSTRRSASATAFVLP